MRIPSVPSSWSELTWEQLTDIWRIIDANTDYMDKYVSVYSYLTGVQIKKADPAITPDNNDSSLVIIYKGQKSLVGAGDLLLYLIGTKIEEGNKLTAAESVESKGVLSWLDEPYTLTGLPKQYIRIDGHKFKMPDPLFTSITYQQYYNLQKILQQYWDIAKKLSQGEENREASSALEQLCAQFMSHFLCSRSLQLVKKDSVAMFLSLRYTYTYSVEKAERNIKHFRKAPRELFCILQQYFSSCMEYYKREMPDLFTDSGKINDKSPLMAEIDTINAIMKWKGAYPTHQDVYDTNAIFIFGDLKDMAREAREIEKANASVKSRR